MKTTPRAYLILYITSIVALVAERDLLVIALAIVFATLGISDAVRELKKEES